MASRPPRDSDLGQHIAATVPLRQHGDAGALIADAGGIARPLRPRRPSRLPRDGVADRQRLVLRGVVAAQINDAGDVDVVRLLPAPLLREAASCHRRLCQRCSSPPRLRRRSATTSRAWWPGLCQRQQGASAADTEVKAAAVFEDMEAEAACTADVEAKAAAAAGEEAKAASTTDEEAQDASATDEEVVTASVADEETKDASAVDEEAETVCAADEEAEATVDMEAEAACSITNELN